MSLKDLMSPSRNPYLVQSDNQTGRQTQYFAHETLDFIKSLGKYADNHYRIEIQKWGEPQKEIVECRIEDVRFAMFRVLNPSHVLPSNHASIPIDILSIGE